MTSDTPTPAVGDPIPNGMLSGAPERLQPVWLLDIDGVINAFRHYKSRKNFWPSLLTLPVEDAQGKVWPFTVAPGLLDYINAQHAAGTDMRWASTWMETANTHVASVFDLPQLAVIDGPRGPSDFYYKQTAAIRLAGAGHPLVWTDDDAILNLTRRKIAETGTPHLLIAPDPVHGLTPDHTERISAFLAKHKHPSI